MGVELSTDVTAASIFATWLHKSSFSFFSSFCFHLSIKYPSNHAHKILIFFPIFPLHSLLWRPQLLFIPLISWTSSTLISLPLRSKSEQTQVLFSLRSVLARLSNVISSSLADTDWKASSVLQAIIAVSQLPKLCLTSPAVSTSA